MYKTTITGGLSYFVFFGYTFIMVFLFWILSGNNKFWHLWYWLWCVPRPPSSSATSTSALRTTAGGGAPSSPLVHVHSLFLPYLPPRGSSPSLVCLSLTLTGGYRPFFSLSLPHSLPPLPPVSSPALCHGDLSLCLNSYSLPHFPLPPIVEHL